ncbi:hypothetical protein F5146DRAFT_1058930 [Armillaria mellea]|nr:hypothetical protein F5146DRAFT_1058930 [Armillaria mellea]
MPMHHAQPVACLLLLFGTDYSRNHVSGSKITDWSITGGFSVCQAFPFKKSAVLDALVILLDFRSTDTIFRPAGLLM